MCVTSYVTNIKVGIYLTQAILCRVRALCDILYLTQQIVMNVGIHT